ISCSEGGAPHYHCKLHSFSFIPQQHIISVMQFFKSFLLMLFLGTALVEMSEHLIREKHVLEGDDVVLSCDLTAKIGEYIQWYRQYPKSRPVFLDMYNPSETEKQFTKADEKSDDLKISSAAVSHSAVYYCALRPTVTGNLLTLYKNLLPSKV
ncbi:T-cell receptor alpha chain V region RL-5, partial [Clarias magur]